MGANAIELFKGDDLTVRLTVTDGADPPAAVDLTGYTEITLTVKESGADASAIIARTLTGGHITVNPGGAGNNIADITFVPANTSSMAPMRYEYDIEGTDSGGLIHTIVKDDLTVIQDVTN